MTWPEIVTGSGVGSFVAVLEFPPPQAAKRGAITNGINLVEYFNFGIKAPVPVSLLSQQSVCFSVLELEQINRQPFVKRENYSVTIFIGCEPRFIPPVSFRRSCFSSQIDSAERLRWLFVQH